MERLLPSTCEPWQSSPLLEANNRLTDGLTDKAKERSVESEVIAVLIVNERHREEVRGGEVR